MDTIFSGKVALVTGAASGIGRATALAFAARGANVLLSDVQKEAGEAAAETVRAAGGEARFVRCDVSRDAEVAHMIREAIDTFGGIDFAVNNAGVEGASAPLEDLDEAEWDRVHGINLKGAWLCMKHEIPALRARGGGSIVNVSSIAGVTGFPAAAAYVASKHGMIGLSRSAALELAPAGIRVNAVCPGAIATPMIDRATGGDAAAAQAFAAAAPMGRMGTPEEIASAIVWLCEPGAAFTTGHALVSDGGWTAR